MKSVKNTVAANNYKNALAELHVVDPTATLPETINDSDKDHFVVALVQRINNAAKLKYDTRISIQPFDAKSYTKLIGNYKTLGYDFVLVLHNPEKAGTDEVDGPKVTESEAEMRERIERELTKKFEEKFDMTPKNVINTANAVEVGGEGATLKTHVPAASETTSAAATEEAKIELNDAKNIDISGYKIDQLKKFAEENELSDNLKGLTKRDDILAALQTWQKES